MCQSYIALGTYLYFIDYINKSNGLSMKLWFRWELWLMREGEDQVCGGAGRRLGGWVGCTRGSLETTRALLAATSVSAFVFYRKTPRQRKRKLNHYNEIFISNVQVTNLLV